MRLDSYLSSTLVYITTLHYSMDPEEDYEPVENIPPPKSELAASLLQKRSAPPIPKRSPLPHIGLPKTAENLQHIEKVSRPPPPRPAPRSAQVNARRTSISQSNHPKRLTLSEFGMKYAKALPLRITVCGGFYGQSDRTTLSGGEIFNIHFMKHTKVVTMKGQYGIQFVVPMHSAIQFGLIYDPYNDNSRAPVKAFQFKKISDILKMPVLPKVICATKSVYSQKPENAIQANEIFVVKGLTEESKQFLKVYSIATRREKYLYVHCDGNFTTLPQSIGLHLPELVSQVPELFPANAVLIMSKGTTTEPPSYLSGVVQLLGNKTEMSFVATNALEESAKNAPLTDIPADLNVEIEVTFPKVNETEKLYEDTKYLYENFNPANVVLLKRPISHKAQSFIDTAISISREPTGIDVIKPEAAYVNSDLHPKIAEVDSHLQASGFQQQTQQSCTNHVTASLTHQELDSPTATSINKQEKVENLMQEVSEVKGIMEKLLQESDHLKHNHQALEEKVHRLEAQVKAGFTERTQLQIESTSKHVTSAATNQEQNKEYIATLNHLQVCFLTLELTY